MRLTDKLAEVCRDYCKEVWAEVLNRAGVPATSEWRLADNTFFPKDIREVPGALLPPVVLSLPPSEQPSTIQASLPPFEVSKGLDKEAKVAEDKEASQGGPQPKDKGKGKEAIALLEAKDADSTAKDADLKEDPPRAKA